MPSFKVEIEDRLDLTKIQELAKKSSQVILVGYPSGRTHIDAAHEQQGDGSYKGHAEAGIETAELTKELYFGTARTPARPFLTDALEEHKDEINKDIADQLKKIAAGMSPNWDLVGTRAVGFIQDFVRGDYYKTNIPNSWRTIEKKGSDTPLIDSADLINSTTYIVEDR